MKHLKLISIFAIAALMVACNPSKESLKKLLVENPDIVFDVIKEHPAKFLEVVNEAAREAQVKQRENAEKEEQNKLEEEFKNPKTPVIDEKRAILGNKDAVITIVEYSDFECPYCTRGYNTMKEVKEKYGDKVRLLYKHLPLDFHPKAMPAAKYFEAIALQDTAKAYKFHDELFENQDKLREQGEKFFEATAKKVGADMAKLKKDLNGEEVKKRIEADIAEARKYDFSGTPGFLVNGISVRGAYPADHFSKIIDRLLAK